MHGLVVLLALSALPTPEAIVSSVAEQHQKYLGLQFDYTVTAEKGAPAKFKLDARGNPLIEQMGGNDVVAVETTRESLRLSKSPDPADPRIWRVWTRSAEIGTPPQWTVTRFLAFNGKQTREF